MQLRTPAEMEAAEQTAPQSDTLTSGSTPFHPTVSLEDLAALKGAVASHAPARRRATSKSSPTLAMAAPSSSPVLDGINVNGIPQGNGILIPADTHGAVGGNQFVQVANQRIAVFSKTNPPQLLKKMTLASFFGYAAPYPGLFSARVIYDPTWKRWIVTANALHESLSPPVQKLLIAVSKTANATGAFFVVSDFNMDVEQNGQFSDFPQLGMDQDAIILTTNVFSDETPTATYVQSEVITFAKARAYNGLDLEAQFIPAGQPGTIAPPVVLDQNPNTFLVAAAPVPYPDGTSLSLFKLSNSSRGSAATLEGPVAVPVEAAYGVPGDVEQLGTTDTLLAGDARFVSAGTQVGDTLWQTHTVDTGDGLPTPVWYKINTETETVAEQGLFYSSATSFDFNASIVANEEGDMFVTWTSTDPDPDPGLPAVNAQVRFSGRTSEDPETDLSPGTALFTSPTFYSPVFFGSAPWPWGSYSAVTIDPANDMRAWLVNQKNNSTDAWGTRIGRIVFP
jgi:hypothetical protein